MAFTVSSQSPQLDEVVGNFGSFVSGMTTMVVGKATITINQFTRLDGIVGIAQAATGVGEIVQCTATSSNTADIETVDENGDAAGTSVVMWIAWGLLRR